MQKVIYKFAKHIFDLLISIELLIISAPIFLLVIAMIHLDSPGSALFAHERIGKNGRKFKLYKFRTMSVSTSKYASKLQKDDPKVTKVGRFLRDTGLDELPQLINVLKGEMSLVGPRPEMPFIVEGYTEREKTRLKIKPGITGLWQVSGKTQKPICDNLTYDLSYIKDRSFALDLKILLRTFLVFLNMLKELLRKKG